MKILMTGCAVLAFAGSAHAHGQLLRGLQSWPKDYIGTWCRDLGANAQFDPPYQRIDNGGDCVSFQPNSFTFAGDTDHCVITKRTYMHHADAFRINANCTSRVSPPWSETFTVATDGANLYITNRTVKEK